MSKPPFRADHVGSFLRPKALLDAREAFRAGDIDAATLRGVEDEAIRDVVRFQEDLGLQSITDGEFRRTYFHTDFLLQLDGVEEAGGTHFAALSCLNVSPAGMDMIEALVRRELKGWID